MDDEEFIREILALVEIPHEVSKPEYRAYYDPTTLAVVCFSQLPMDMPYCIINENWYSTYRPELFEIIDGHVCPRDTSYLNKNRLISGTKFATIKGNMQIAVDDTYNGERQYWDRR